MDSIPVPVFTGNVHTYIAGQGVLQEIERQRDADSISVCRPITKRTWQAARVDQLPRILQRAFTEMLSGRPGSVVVDLPVDVQCDGAEVVPEELDGRELPSRAMPDPARMERVGRLLISRFHTGPRAPIAAMPSPRGPM